jgi:hypothetical protein
MCDALSREPDVAMEKRDDALARMSELELLQPLPSEAAC